VPGRDGERGSGKRLSLSDTQAALGFLPAAAHERAGVTARASELVALDAVPVAAWSMLFARAAEPNPFYSPEWALAVHEHARGHRGAQALLAWDSPAKNRLIGMLPVVSAWRALKLPLPVLVAWQGYVPLSVPLLDCDEALRAAQGLLAAARQAGAKALLLPYLTGEGAAARAFRDALASQKRSPVTLHTEERALLDATADPEAMLQEALGSKKLKELRRQRNRLNDDGEVQFSVNQPAELTDALNDFLALEAAGWKGKRGTALGAHEGDREFIESAAAKLSAQDRFFVARLMRGKEVLAAGLALRHGARAYFYKVTHDERLAKCSPGVQLTLELTRHFCADNAVTEVDSTASADHPMINHIWKKRLVLTETLLPLSGGTIPIRLSILLRRTLREGARRIVHRYRAFREKSS